MGTLGDKLASKIEQNEQLKFSCNICNYVCCKKFNYERHLLSSRHIQLTVGDNLANKNEQKNKKYCCEKCNKPYSSRNGLWKHSKICNTNIQMGENENTNKKDEISNKKDEISDKELIMMLIKDNSELKNMMMKVIENGTNNITTNNNTTNMNSHNKAFNLNFFLNETCKDAMNIMDFVESIKFQLSDLESVGEKGYIEGISNIIIKNLKDLDVTQRPVHCTDKKRETIYVKDEDKWEKDDDNKKMHKMVRKVQDKNFRMIQKFKEKYPNYYKASSKESDVYNNIIIESMGGKGDNDFEKEEKIIKKVSKEIVVEK
jgi:hypothetical protein